MMIQKTGASSKGAIALKEKPRLFNPRLAGGGGGAYVGPLDTYTGAKGAWSLYRRLLSSYTGPLVRIRRDGDNAEQDFQSGANGLISVAAVEAFCVAGGGSEDGHVVTVYDQSGNGLDMEQSSAGMQMRLCEGGVVNLVGPGYPSMRSVAGNDCLYATDTFTPAYSGSNAWLFTHQSITNSSDTWNSVSLSKDAEANWNSSGRGIPLSVSSGNIDAVRAGVHSSPYTLSSAPNLHLATAAFIGSGWLLDVGGNGTEDTATPEMQGNFDANRFLLGAYSPSSPYCGIYSYFVEAVIYLSEMGADQSAIRAALKLPLE